MQPLRIGILSTAGIARKNWRAIHHSGNAIVTAVASRDKARAREFIRTCQDDLPFDIIPDAIGSYEELIHSPNVDAIYNPLPTGLRKEWNLMAAAAKKHVICEKPCALNLADLRAQTDACAANGVQFMDGVMFMHNPRMAQARQILADAAAIGQLKRLTSMFAFGTNETFFTKNIRAHSELEPTGCLGDLGWYCLRFFLWSLNWQLPTKVTAQIIASRGNANSPGTAPTEFSAELLFPGGVSANLYCAFVVDKQQWVQVSGSKGYLRIDDFVHPHDPQAQLLEVNRQLIPAASMSHSHDVNLFRSFATQVASGKLNPDWPMWALKTQEAMDMCWEAAKR